MQAPPKQTSSFSEATRVSEQKKSRSGRISRIRFRQPSAPSDVNVEKQRTERAIAMAPRAVSTFTPGANIEN